MGQNFTLKIETYSGSKMVKMRYLNKTKNKDFVSHLNQHFETRGPSPRIRRGKHQEIETLKGEEALLLLSNLETKDNGFLELQGRNRFINHVARALAISISHVNNLECTLDGIQLE